VLPGFDTEVQTFLDTRHFTDPDGSSHALLNFHYLTTALETETTKWPAPL
jgi:hypothetical protein